MVLDTWTPIIYDNQTNSGSGHFWSRRTFPKNIFLANRVSQKMVLPVPEFWFSSGATKWPSYIISMTIIRSLHSRWPCHSGIAWVSESPMFMVSLSIWYKLKLSVKHVLVVSKWIWTGHGSVSRYLPLFGSLSTHPPLIVLFEPIFLSL